MGTGGGERGRAGNKHGSGDGELMGWEGNGDGEEMGMEMGMG